MPGKVMPQVTGLTQSFEVLLPTVKGIMVQVGQGEDNRDDLEAVHAFSDLGLQLIQFFKLAVWETVADGSIPDAAPLTLAPALALIF